MKKINYYISNIFDWNLWLHISDKKIDVLENRKKIASKLWLNLDNFVFMNQTHSWDIEFVLEKDKWKWVYDFKNTFECDCLVTSQEDLVVCVLVADCVPIIFYDENKNIIAVAHAGWRWTHKKIAKNTIIKMLELWSELSDIKIIIWPSISKSSYEVWKEVGDNFRDEVKTNLLNNKLFLDLKLENKIQALESWIKESNIEIIGIDTFTDNNYFSARRNWFSSWRFGAFIWIKKQYENK